MERRGDRGAQSGRRRCPDQDIIVVHRSDGSGTTYIFTDYLSKVSSDWKSQVGNATSVKWPVGLGGKGNEGVAGTLTQNDGSIGYVELAYAIENKLPYAKMKNAAGTTVGRTRRPPRRRWPISPARCPIRWPSRS